MNGGASKGWMVAALGLLAALLISSGVTAYLYQQNLSLAEARSDLLKSLKGVSYAVNVLIDYGNGSRTWYNGTLVPIGFSVFNATIYVTNGNVDYAVYPGMGEFITGINGAGPASDPRYESWWWSLWRWDEDSKEWVLSEMGASLLLLQDGDTVGWKLLPGDRGPEPP